MTLGHSVADLKPGLRAMSRSMVETKVSGLVTRGRDGCVSSHVPEWARMTPDCGQAGLGPGHRATLVFRVRDRRTTTRDTDAHSSSRVPW